MNSKTIIPFEIIRIDPLGQGVSLLDDKVTFISKAIPGDKGIAEVIETKGPKVQFAKIQELTTQSEERTESPCPHFNECQGCAYLNMNYKKEGSYKKEAYSFLFKEIFSPEEIEYIEAPQRLNYRNRIQLSYDLVDGSIGFKTREGILEIPNCMIAKEPIQKELQKFYQNDKYWHNLLPKDAPKEGHIELYLLNGELKTTVNQPYSSGGFSQVHQEMADLARNQISQSLEKESPTTGTIELFGGSGFLTEGYQGPRVICDQDLGNEDSYKVAFIDMNLFGKFGPEKVNKVLGNQQSVYSTDHWQMIIDPPRSGLKNFAKFLNQPNLSKDLKQIAYLSCNPQTQVRDLKNLLESKKWRIQKITFFDFFPATHHLESLVILERL